jgi:hypothetical protein
MQEKINYINMDKEKLSNEKYEKITNKDDF